jgi:phosphatidylglycerophosphatase C
MTPRPIVAAFDVDGTLTTRDCVVPFLRRSLGTSRVLVVLARHPILLVIALIRRDRDRVKELAVSAFAGRSAAAIAVEGERFAADVEERSMRPDSRARLAWHRRQGHQVVLVSASLDAYLQPLGERLGVDGVLCAMLDVGADGNLTGRLVGRNCRGPEKVARLEAWLAGRDVELWAYGDSAGDRELLARADRPHLVAGLVITAVPAGSAP